MNDLIKISESVIDGHKSRRPTDHERRQCALEARQDAIEGVAHKALHPAAVAEAKAQATAIASDDYSVLAWVIFMDLACL
jgi:hypothetical protein